MNIEAGYSDKLFFLRPLLIVKEGEELDEVFFESLEDSLVVFGGTDMLFKSGHALGDGVLGEGAAVGVVVVNIAHAELRLEAHGAGEELY